MLFYKTERCSEAYDKVKFETYAKYEKKPVRFVVGEPVIIRKKHNVWGKKVWFVKSERNEGKVVYLKLSSFNCSVEVRY